MASSIASLMTRRPMAPPLEQSAQYLPPEPGELPNPFGQASDTDEAAGPTPSMFSPERVVPPPNPGRLQPGGDRFAQGMRVLTQPSAPGGEPVNRGVTFPSVPPDPRFPGAVTSPGEPAQAALPRTEAQPPIGGPRPVQLAQAGPIGTVGQAVLSYSLADGEHD